MHARTRHALALAAVLLLVVSGAASALEKEETIDQTFPLATGGEVSIRNVNGSIQVATWDRDEVRVVAVKKVRASSGGRADEILARTKVSIETSADRVSVKTELPKSSGGFLAWVFGNDSSASVSYEVTVPDRADVEVGTTNGKLKVRDVAGRVDASSTNGSIDLAGIRGSVDASTTNGSVSVALAEIVGDQDMSFSSTNGGIRVTVPRSAHLSIRASTTNGGIHLDDLAADIRSKSRRRLVADVNGGGPRMHVSTTNGGIRINGG
jgi:hypothetical protein